MHARIASNVETAALLPEGAEVKAFKAGLSRIEQAKADYLHELVAFGTREVIDPDRIKHGLFKAAFGFGPTADDLRGIERRST